MTHLILPHPDQHYGCVTYSQHGEDIFILNAMTLMGFKKFSWLDIGAHHPVNISNTYLFYQRDMRGVNIDANTNAVAALKALRPEDQSHCVAVGRDPSPSATYYMFDEMSGLNTFSLDLAKRFEDTGRVVKSQVKVPMVSLAGAVTLYCGGKFPELLLIDAEELDFEILDGWESDESKGRPVVICVESRNTFKFVRLMTKLGYFLTARLGANLVFIAAPFYSSYFSPKI